MSITSYTEVYVIPGFGKAYINGIKGSDNFPVFDVNIVDRRKDNLPLEKIGVSIISIDEARGRLEGFFHAIRKQISIPGETTKSGWSEDYCTSPCPRPPTEKLSLTACLNC